MKLAIKIFLALNFVQYISMFSIAADDNNATTLVPEEDETTTEYIDSPSTTEATENSETEEVCTCCPLTPAFLNDDSSKINAIKEKLKSDVAKLERKFNTKKQRLQDKLKKLEDEATPLKIKLREVRKVNRDKEEELKIEEITEKSLEFRKRFKEVLDRLSELSEKRFNAKKEYNDVAKACRISKGDEDYDEDTCKAKLSEKLDAIDLWNQETSANIENIKVLHEESVSLEISLKNAQEELWSTIYKNRESIKDDIFKMDEIYSEISEVNQKLEELGSEYERDQIKLNNEARKAVENVKPKKPYKWIPWNESKKDVPTNAISGGYDLDSVNFYIIRREKDDDYQYGKFAAKRGDAYICKEFNEVTAFDFEILTGENFFWCPVVYGNYQVVDENYPICKASYKSSVIPGYLMDDGTCRVGFGWDTFYRREGVERLSFGKC